MWNLPSLGIKPVSPALAGRSLSTVPPRKSPDSILNEVSVNFHNINKPQILQMTASVTSGKQTVLLSIFSATDQESRVSTSVSAPSLSPWQNSPVCLPSIVVLWDFLSSLWFSSGSPLPASTSLEICSYAQPQCPSPGAVLAPFRDQAQPS